MHINLIYCSYKNIHTRSFKHLLLLYVFLNPVPSAIIGKVSGYFLHYWSALVELNINIA